jgi:hypothetical protein
MPVMQTFGREKSDGVLLDDVELDSESRVLLIGRPVEGENIEMGVRYSLIAFLNYSLTDWDAGGVGFVPNEE